MIFISKSKRANKRYVADFGHKRVHFGSANHENYTIHRNKVRQLAYQRRHAGDNLTDGESAGALSFYLLWSSPTLVGGGRNYERKFGKRIIWQI